MTDSTPVTPINGKILIRQLPFKPSKTIEIISNDRADENEGIVVSMAPFKYGRRKIRGGWEMTGDTFPQEVQVGDRVLFPGKYQDDDTSTFNGVKHRFLDPWEIIAVIERPQPEGYENALTGEKTPDSRIQLIR